MKYSRLNESQHYRVVIFTIEIKTIKECTSAGTICYEVKVVGNGSTLTTPMIILRPRSPKLPPGRGHAA